MQGPPYVELISQWRACAATGLVTLEELLVGDPPRLLLSARINAERAEKIFIGAGVHGDEPVTPWALLSIVNEGLLDPRYGYHLWPCMNPSGYDRGTRQNIDGQDINRSYGLRLLSVEANAIISSCGQERYRLLMDLHEDYEADGVYLYEPVVAEPGTIGRCILDRIEEKGHRLQEFHPEFDLGYPPNLADEMRILERGRVLSNIENEWAYFSGGLPLTMHVLKSEIARRTLTLESPRCFPWQDRMDIHRTAVVSAVACLEHDHTSL